jgi:hypothetical protein
VSGTCDAAAEAITRRLGFNCHDVSPVVSFHNPFDLASWTQPILELTIIAGAIFAFFHARRRLREGDPTNLAIWFASLVYLFVTEPPLYFPEWFGLDKQFGFIFAHNIFTVQFMWDRLPLYIIAIYPAMSAIAYELVRVLGVFRRGVLVGAVAVAFVCQVFYEVFDQLGPQLKWWAWNDANVKVNHPALASVPMSSMLLFASVSFGAMTYLTVRLAGSRDAGGQPRRGWSLVWRIVVAGVLTPAAMGVAGIPSGIFGGNHPHIHVQAAIIGVELGLVWLAGAWVLITQFTRHVAPEPITAFARVYPAAYLAVMAGLWLSAVPAYLDATHGITKNGTPIGSGPYAIACFIGAGATLTLLYSHQRVPATVD